MQIALFLLVCVLKKSAVRPDACINLSLCQISEIVVIRASKNPGRFNTDASKHLTIRK